MQMNFIKPTKEKIKLFLFMILAAIISAVLFIFVNRFLATNYYLSGQSIYYRLALYFVGIFRYIIIAYLTVAFYKNKLSPKGEYYYIFRVVVLLTVFSYLYRSALAYVGSTAPEIFFSNWVNVGFVVGNLVLYYLLACLVYKFDLKK